MCATRATTGCSGRCELIHPSQVRHTHESLGAYVYTKEEGSPITKSRLLCPSRVVIVVKQTPAISEKTTSYF